MKKILKGLSLLLTVSMLLSLCAMIAFAADVQKITVTAEKTTIYEKASTESQKLISAGKGYTFTPIASTKSFWKLEFKKKNDATAYTGFVLKSDTKGGAIASSSTAKGETDSKTKVGMVYKPYSKSTGKKDPAFPPFIFSGTMPTPSEKATSIPIPWAEVVSITPVFIPKNSDFQIIDIVPMQGVYCGYDLRVKCTVPSTPILKIDIIDYSGVPHTFYCDVFFSTGYSGAMGGESIIAQGTEVAFDANKPVISWESSNSNVASIGQDGTVTANSPGTTFVTAYFENNASSSKRVTVK